jgi:murein DD-endopeptidase MepM/ murein hydrolase activator NlpD/plastocyanin
VQRRRRPSAPARALSAAVAGIVAVTAVLGAGAGVATAEEPDLDEVRVEVGDDHLDPAVVRIEPGDTVVWVHGGEAPLRLVAPDGAFDSSPDCDGAGGPCLEPGASFAHRFDEEAVVAYLNLPPGEEASPVELEEIGRVLAESEADADADAPAEDAGPEPEEEPTRVVGLVVVADDDPAAGPPGSEPGLPTPGLPPAGPDAPPAPPGGSPGPSGPDGPPAPPAPDGLDGPPAPPAGADGPAAPPAPDGAPPPPPPPGTPPSSPTPTGAPTTGPPPAPPAPSTPLPGPAPTGGPTTAGPPPPPPRSVLDAGPTPSSPSGPLPTSWLGATGAATTPTLPSGSAGGSPVPLPPIDQGADVDGSRSPGPGAGAFPDDLQALQDSVVRTGASTTQPLLDALAAHGLEGEEAIAKGFGRFPVGGLATYVHDWWFPRYGPGWRLHQGTDIFAARGTPVRAPAAGTVRISDGGLGGLSVHVDEADGTYWYLTHLDGIAPGLTEGMAVVPGQTVGFVGSSGNARGGPPHLHLQLHPGGGSPVDPKPVLDQMLAEAIAAVPDLAAGVDVATLAATSPGSGDVTSLDWWAAPALPDAPRLLSRPTALEAVLDAVGAAGAPRLEVAGAVGGPASEGPAVLALAALLALGATGLHLHRPLRRPLPPRAAAS